MANGNGFVQRAPLPPLNSPTIAEADRARVYGLVGRELNNLLNGAASYHRDSVKKSSKDLMSELDGLIDSVENLKGAVNDPENIVEDALRDLKGFRDAFSAGVGNDIETMWNNPKDERDSRIKLPDSLAPTTEDNRIIDPDSEPGPYSTPNPLSPNQWRKDMRASIRSSNDVAASAASFDTRLVNRVLNSASGSVDPLNTRQLPPTQQIGIPLAIFTGQPMPSWTTSPPLGGLLNNSNASGNGDLVDFLTGLLPRNPTPPETPQQTADSIPERRLRRNTYSISPASAFDTGTPAVPPAPSADANYSGGLLGMFAALAGSYQNQPAPPDDEQEQADLQALEAKLSSSGGINDAWALYKARVAGRR